LTDGQRIKKLSVGIIKKEFQFDEENSKLHVGLCRNEKRVKMLRSAAAHQKKFPRLIHKKAQNRLKNVIFVKKRSLNVNFVDWLSPKKDR